MAYVEKTTTSYGKRLKNSVGGIGMGFIMLIAGIILLFWNEGRTVKTTKMLKEAQKVCIDVPDISTVNPELNGQVIHATGMAKTDETLSESQFGVSANAIKLIRKVEYYQVVEHAKTETKDKVGGGQETTTTYTYEAEWCDEPVNSASFKDPSEQDDNWVLIKIDDQELQAKNVAFGGYRLSEELIGQKNDKVALNPVLDEEYVAYLNEEISNLVEEDGDFVHVSGNVVYLGGNPNRPYIGDVRISFYTVDNGEVSIIAKVAGDSFEKFTAKNGYSLQRLSTGVHGMDEMFQTEHSSNKTMSWILRLVGFLLILGGLRNIFKILETLFKVLPFLANIVGLGLNIATFVLALAITLIVIALGWLWYRPLLGILLLVAACAIIWFFAKKGKAAPAAPAGEPVAPAAPAAPAEPAAPAAPAEPVAPAAPAQPEAPKPEEPAE